MSNVAVHIQNAIQKVLREKSIIYPDNCCVCLMNDGHFGFKFEKEEDLKVFAILHGFNSTYTHSQFKQGCTRNYIKT